MRVEFLLTNAHEVLHFAPVARALIKMGVDTVFVSPRGDTNITGNRWYNADAAEDLMKRLEVPFVSRPNPNADAALTTSSSYVLRGYRNVRARMNYGVSLVDYTVFEPAWSAWFAGFDLILVHGPFDISFARRYMVANAVRAIGYPRYDAWFNSPPDSNLVREKYGVASSNPIILYLPTWQHRSSIDTFADSIFGLSPRFKILVKPHHGTYQREPERMRKLRSGPVKLLSPLTLPEEAFSLADVVISDADSGALTDAILVKKRVVCLANAGQVEKLLLPEIRRELPICASPEQLPEKVDEAFARTTLSDGLQRLRRHIFDTTEGGDAARAAKIIVESRRARRRGIVRQLRTELIWRKEYLKRLGGRIGRRYGLLQRSPDAAQVSR
jgi:CDP-Glycerol:Poly(glycerophosphate) glycerophosphotransferase